MLKRLLVSSAHYILGPFAAEENLRATQSRSQFVEARRQSTEQWWRCAGKSPERFLRLWETGEAFEPLGLGPTSALGADLSHSQRQPRDLWGAEGPLRAEDAGREVRQKTRGQADARDRAVRMRREQEESPHHPSLADRAYPAGLPLSHGASSQSNLFVL